MVDQSQIRMRKIQELKIQEIIFQLAYFSNKSGAKRCYTSVNIYKNTSELKEKTSVKKIQGNSSVRKRITEALDDFIPQLSNSPRKARQAQPAYDKYQSLMKMLIPNNRPYSEIPVEHMGKDYIEQKTKFIIKKVQDKYSKSNRRIMSQIPNCIIKSTDDEEQIEKVMALTNNLRRVRIKNIYEQVLFKAGKKPAQELLGKYFANATQLVDVNQMEHDVLKKREEEILDRNINQEGCKIVSYKNINRSTSVPRIKGKSPGSPQIKRNRINQYGRWYLDPENFSAKLNEINYNNNL